MPSNRQQFLLVLIRFPRSTSLLHTATSPYEPMGRYCYIKNSFAIHPNRLLSDKYETQPPTHTNTSENQ